MNNEIDDMVARYIKAPDMVVQGKGEIPDIPAGVIAVAMD